MSKKKQKERNLVHKHALNFNRSETFKDRKKSKKKGYMKHKPSKSEGFLVLGNVLSFMKDNFGITPIEDKR